MGQLVQELSFTRNRMLVPCFELLDRIELKDENDEPLSFIGIIYLLIGPFFLKNHSQ